MFYVLRTHGEIESHWGFTAVGRFTSKQEAKEHCQRVLQAEPTKDKFVVVKAITYFKYVIEDKAWQQKEFKL